MEGLIRLASEKDIFYDSIKGQYRYRMHCPECGEVSGCRCFDSIEELEKAVYNDALNMCCSSKCALILNVSEIGDCEFIDVLVDKGYISLLDRLKNYIIRESENYYGITAKICGFLVSLMKIELSYTYLANKLTEEQAREIQDELYSDWDYPDGESCEA